MQNVHKQDQKSSRYWLLLILMSFLIVGFFTLSVYSHNLVVYRGADKKSILTHTAAIFAVGVMLHMGRPLLVRARCSVFHTVCQCLLSGFFTLMSILGVYFEISKPKPMEVVFTSWLTVLSVPIAFAGGCIFFFLVFRFICGLSGTGDRPASGSDPFGARFFGKHCWRNCMLTLFVCWLPQYVLRFPGVMPYDAWQSLAMYQGFTTMTTQHPMIWNMILGGLTDIGIGLGIKWFAMLVICIVHYVLGMVMVAYTIATLKKLGVSNRYLAGTLVFFAVLPPMALLASTVYNDYVFGLSILLLINQLIHYLYDREGFFKSVHHWLLLALAVLGTFLRYNGLYTVAAVVAFVGIHELWRLVRRKDKLLRSALIIGLLVVPLLGGLFMQSTLNKRYQAVKLTSRAMLAMPIQQSVRCLKTHGTEIPQPIYDELHNLLTWSDEKYAEEYNPRNFDAVKNSFRSDASTDELIRFVKAWVKLVLRYPGTCFLATANQTYYLFSPLVTNVRYYISSTSHDELAEYRYGLVPAPYIFSNETLDLLADRLATFYHQVFPAIPVLGLLENQAVYVLLLLAMSLCTLLRKDRRPLILMVGLLVILLIVLVGPAVYRHPRYTFPLCVCMPLLIAAFRIADPEGGVAALAGDRNDATEPAQEPAAGEETPEADAQTVEAETAPVEEENVSPQ